MIDYERIDKLCQYENAKILKGCCNRDEHMEILNQAYLGLTCEMFEALTSFSRRDPRNTNLEIEMDCVEESYDVLQNAVHCLTIKGNNAREIQDMIKGFRSQYRTKNICALPQSVFPRMGESITKYVLKGTFLESKSAPEDITGDILEIIVASENFLNRVSSDAKYNKIDIPEIMNRKLTKWESKIDTF